MSPSAGATQDEIRRRNVGTLLRRVHVHGAQSRAQLTASMGLNRSTIKVLVEELTEVGLVTETIPEVALRAGRPSHVVVPRCDTAYVLAANVAVDTVTAAAVGLGGVILGQREYRMSASATKPAVVARRLATEFGRLRDTLPPSAWLCGVGVGVPGVVRTSDGLVEFAPNLMWRSAPFGRLLADQLRASLDVSVEVRVGNDGDLGGLAEHVRGSGRGIDNLIYLAGEVGVGGGIIVEGKILTGSQGYAGELGHMTVNPGGRKCRCGSRGCFETEIGEEAVLLACGRDPAGGRAALLDVFTAADAGDRRALDGLHEIAIWVARGLATLVNLFNPDVVILGGPLSSLFFLTEDVIASEMASMTMFAGRRRARLVPPGLGQDSSLLGAAELAFEPLINGPLDSWARGRAG